MSKSVLVDTCHFDTGSNLQAMLEFLNEVD